MRNPELQNEYFADAKNRSHLLQYLANTRGDFKVAFCFKSQDGENHFSKHYTIIKCQELDNFEHIEKASHRQIFDEEIVLDFDYKDFKSYDDMVAAVEKCKKDLLERHFEFKLFFTGSTGFHLHIPFNKGLFPTTERLERLRSVMIRKYHCDIQKKSAKNLIALEFAPHWKTGNQKKLIFDNTTEDLLYELSR